jgi:hypothetical protein
MKNDPFFWSYDESIRLIVIYYYWPYFIMGNLDDWMKLGITLNGAHPLNLC